MKKTKYIFVSGGVISGIGKGLTSSSIALLLKSAGYRVAPIKFENYLNLDAGTINPIEHGDPFLCEDGTEGDMDVGTYEKFLNEEMGKENFVTMGQVYKSVIDRERRMEYDGEDVEAIPHITNEIIGRIKNVSKKKNADIVIIELGGTAGEYQNILYYEASRIMTLKYPGDIVHIHVSYMPTPKHLGEAKTKPTQLSVRTLNSMGIQPDFIIARSEGIIDKRRRDRFALFCNIQPENIISNPDVENVHFVPLILEEQHFTEKIQKKLGLPVRKANMSQWKNFVEKIKTKKKKTIEIAIVGKYFGTGEYQIRDSYAALFDAIDHASTEKHVSVTAKWIDAELVEKKGESVIGNPDGIIVPIGWGKRGAKGMIAAAGFARRKKIPYLGLCYGMQLAVVSFAREVLGWKDADTTENNPSTKYPVIHTIKGQKELLKKRAYGATMRLGGWDAIVKKNTFTHKIYNSTKINERHRHRYEFNNKYVTDFENAGLTISARSVRENLVEIVELSQEKHPFYIGIQGHPEYKSRPLLPHPLFLAFIEACLSADRLVKNDPD